MATEGIQGFYIGTRNYGATAALWSSLGFKNIVETDHGSGRWEHPSGGPYVWISETHEQELAVGPILRVADSTTFAPERAPQFAQPFTPQHWGVMEALIVDPDGRNISLEAPLPDGVEAPPETDHDTGYGTD
jgi:hypothetical protein